MSKEVMQQALEALENAEYGDYDKKELNKAIIALREALAKPDFWEGYVPEPDNTCNNALREQGKAYPRTCKKCGLGPCVELAQQALDKMAENAREQPAQKCSYPYCGCNSKAWCKVERNEALDKKAENARELGLDYEPAQQEPVAYIHRQGNHYEVSERFLSDDEKSRGWTEEPLYTSPPAQHHSKAWPPSHWTDYERSIAAAEREACAKAADDQWVRNPNVSGGDAIRARSNT